MIPTISDKNGNDLDFNPLDIRTYNGFVNMIGRDKDIYLQDDYSTLSVGPSTEPLDTNNVTGSAPAGAATSARNHGILVPPGLTAGFGF